MHIPTTLKHKPVLVAEDYGRIDGRTAYGSDAQGLSLGLAQWNDRGKVDISAKVWRHTGEKWSRQSEELPLHRVLDLAILACRAQLYFQEEAYRFPRGYDPEHPQVDRIGLQGDAMTVEVCTSSDHIDEDLRLFQDALARDGELLGERMRVLARLLGSWAAGAERRNKRGPPVSKRPGARVVYPSLTAWRRAALPPRRG